jgi:uncharacterized protein
MSGETNLEILLKSMEPVLDPRPFGFAVVEAFAAVPDKIQPFALIREEEGVTVIATLADLDKSGLSQAETWAKISLKVHSSLSAVGLTARFATALSDEGISANVVAGFYHDHIFVQWDRSGDAMRALRQLSQSAG